MQRFFLTRRGRGRQGAGVTPAEFIEHLLQSGQIKSLPDFAAQHDRDHSTIYRHVRGAVPTREGRRFWFVVSGGRVTPNDFDPLDVWRGEIALEKEA